MFDLTWLQKYFSWRKEMLVKGRSYYKKGSVNEVGMHRDGNGTVVNSKVNGTRYYSTTIAFDKNGFYRESYCNCPYNQGSDGEICKHIAALYLYLKNNNTPDAVKTIAGKDFLNDFFENLEAPINKKNVNLSYQIDYNQGWMGSSWSFSFKIGLDRLYVVKNTREFTECLINGGKIDFGKRFSFNSRIHSFNDNDRNVIEFLLQLYSAENAFKGDYYSGSGGIFNGKNIRLNEDLFIKLCSYMKNRKISLKINETVHEDVNIEYDNEPYRILIKNDRDKIIAAINYNNDYKFLGSQDRIIFSDNKIYVLNNDKKTYEFLNIFRKRKVDSMEFAGEEKRKFLSIIPQILSEGNIKVSEEISKNYIKAEMQCNLYLDKYRKGICITSQFKYDDYIINPFNNNIVSPFIVRNYTSENQVVRLIEDAEFKIRSDKIYLDDYDKIYLFFRDILPALRSLSSIYYTDDVKGMYLGRIKSYRSYVNNGFGGDLIDINVEMEGIDKKEVQEILRAIKEKKNYHKLKNGKIVSLEGVETEKFYNLLDNIEIDEMEDNVIKLSKYRAIGVFENIREKDDFGIDNTEEIFELIDKIKNPSIQNIDIPDKFKNILRDYQMTGYKWLYTLAQSGFAGILADDMGLGKTIQAIALMYNTMGSSTSIVVVPSSLVYNWENEIKKFAPEMKVLVVSGNKTLRADMINEISGSDVVITSYPLMRRDIDLYEGITFEYCILDEAQHIKNAESINAHSVKRINAKHRFALTGTPMENSLIELWSIFDFLMPGYLFSKSRFSDKFEKQILKNEDNSALIELKRMISPFILRRKKKDVLKELPDKIETKLVCELQEEQKKLYMAYISRAREEIEQKIENEGFDKSRIQILSMITRLRQICCHPAVFVEGYKDGSGKMDLLEELLDELIEGEHRILLFSQFTSLLEIIKSRLDEKNIKYLYLDGTIPSYKRMNLVDNFNEGEGSVFLISLKAGGTGLNLTSADCVIHFDPWWNPAVEDQASDRAHRIGQENVVEVFKLITKDTIEEKIFELQNKKRELINSVIQEGETFINKLTQDEIMDLFRIES